MIEGYYYLHTNGSLIYKRNLDNGMEADFRESDLVRAFWPIDVTDRETCWRILIEASALGAKPERIDELADIWQCNDDDARIYAQRVGCELFMDGDQWCATDRHFVNLQESPAGFGKTCLSAMAALCKDLGYRGGKTLGPTFSDLLNRREHSQLGVGA